MQNVQSRGVPRTGIEDHCFSSILGSLCALGIIFFSNKAKVTLILHTAHSENDMNMTMGKSIKFALEFKVCRSRVSSEAELFSCPLTVSLLRELTLL